MLADIRGKVAAEVKEELEKSYKIKMEEKEKEIK